MMGLNECLEWRDWYPAPTGVGHTSLGMQEPLEHPRMGIRAPVGALGSQMGLCPQILTVGLMVTSLSIHPTHVGLDPTSPHVRVTPGVRAACEGGYSQVIPRFPAL